MRKVFIVAGELSGDRLGQWYCQKIFTNKQVYLEGIGGSSLQAVGMHQYADFKALNITGIIEIIKHIPSLLSFLKKLASHVVASSFDEVVLIDFPGFNLRLAKALKKLNKNIKITYVSPPQLWCWGAWRLSTLKKYCDDVIVLYPFEVDWYKKHGMDVRWIGNPVYQRMHTYFGATKNKNPVVAILPGSRKHEVDTLLPTCLSVMRSFLTFSSDISFLIVVAESIDPGSIRSHIEREGLMRYGQCIKLIDKQQDPVQSLAQCCLALTKPGTVTLELALLGIPTVMFFKTSWLNYHLAKMVVKVNHMALPNLIAPQPLYPEFIQQQCRPGVIFDYAWHLYQGFVRESDFYYQLSDKLIALRAVLQKND